jgi:hypothetical protein
LEDKRRREGVGEVRVDEDVVFRTDFAECRESWEVFVDARTESVGLVSVLNLFGGLFGASCLLGGCWCLLWRSWLLGRLRGRRRR